MLENKRLWASGIALSAALFMAQDGLADTDARLKFGLGAVSEDFLSRGNAHGQLAFNGAYLSAGRSLGQFDFDITLAAQVEDPTDAIPFVDASFRFADDTWRIGVGKQARHWSPSAHTSLVLSRGAPTFPAIYLRKERATQSDLAAFSWLGPWRGEVFLGQTSDTRQPDDSLIIGMQFAFEPIRNLEVELVRMIQLGGAGQDNSGSAIFNALLGRTNEGAGAGANQLAGIGLSYSFKDFGSDTRIYAQVVGEDEAGGLPSCLFYLAGVETRTKMFGADTTVSLETVDTRVDRTDGGFCGPNTAYNNGTYSYAQDGVVLGAPIDSESRSVDLRVRHDFTDWSMNWGLGYYEINDASDPNHRLSSSRVSGAVVSLGAERALWGGTLSATAVYQGFDLDTARQGRGTRFGLGFSKSF